MASDWSTVDALIRGLGSVRAAANARGGAADMGVEHAISDAADAIGLIEHPGDREELLRAHDAVRAARNAMAALNAESFWSGRVRAGARELSEESRRLIDQATRIKEAGWRAQNARNDDRKLSRDSIDD